MLGIGRKLQPTLKRIRLIPANFGKTILKTPYKFLTINKRKLDRAISQLNSSGINPEGGTNLIVSLTSFPERMYDIHYTLYSLLTQSLRPEKVILWLAREQFPRGERDIPATVLKLRDYGLSIEWCEDLKSYKKLVPALREYPEKCIATADDDTYYPSEWLEQMHAEYRKCPSKKTVYAHRARRAFFLHEGELAPYKQWSIKQVEGESFFHVGTGGAGILYPPHTLHEDVLNPSLFQKLAPQADDLYFWAMAILKKTTVKAIHQGYHALIITNHKRELGQNGEFTLLANNVDRKHNDIYLHNIVSHYPIILQTLIAHS